MAAFKVTTEPSKGLPFRIFMQFSLTCRTSVRATRERVWGRCLTGKDLAAHLGACPRMRARYSFDRPVGEMALLLEELASL
jgi:hypothetical protein